nr:hypothetical protein Q903MT_gene1184 [Picea sitchensis]
MHSIIELPIYNFEFGNPDGAYCSETVETQLFFQKSPFGSVFGIDQTNLAYSSKCLLVKLFPLPYGRATTFIFFDYLYTSFRDLIYLLLI